MATLIAANVGTDGATALANGRKLVRAPSGRLWAVYSKVVEVGLDYYSNVFAAYSDDGGESWTEEQLTEKDADQQYPSIAVDKNSVVRVVWQGYGWGVNTGWHNIQYRMRTDSWQAQEAVTDAASHQRLPSIAVDEDGYAHVAWEGTGWGENPNDYNIQYRKRTDSWQAQEAVTDVATHQASFGPPSLAVDSDGYVHVVWCDESAEDWNIRYRKRTDSWQAQEAVTDAGLNVLPSLAVDGGGAVHVAWMERDLVGGFWNIRYRRRTTSWQTPVNIAEEELWPALCDGLASGYALIWTAYDGEKYDVVFYGELAADVEVSAVTATATSASPVPTVTATRNATIEAVVATATSQALVPSVTAAVSVAVEAVTATATAEGLTPTVLAVQNATISAIPPPTTNAAALVPTVTATQNVTVESPCATASGEALAPTVSAVQNASIEVPVATATSEALVPTVTGQQNASVEAAVATATAVGLAPEITATVWLDSLSIKVSLTRPARIWATVTEPGKLRAHFNRPERIYAKLIRTIRR